MMLCLRKVADSDMREDRNLMDCEIVFTGTEEECKNYAALAGCKWKANENYLFKGYWRSEDFCLLPDLAT